MVGQEPLLKLAPVRFCHKFLWIVYSNKEIVTIQTNEVIMSEHFLCALGYRNQLQGVKSYE
nr:MAG TPA: hypothetical protein [Bacteriophage sp.]